MLKEARTAWGLKNIWKSDAQCGHAFQAVYFLARLEAENFFHFPTWFARYFRRFSSAQQRSGSAIIHTSPVGIATSAPLLLTFRPNAANKTDFTGATWKSPEVVQQLLMNAVCSIGIRYILLTLTSRYSVLQAL